MSKTSDYEFRVTSYQSLRFKTPTAYLLSASVMAELRRWADYDVLFADAPEWEDRANQTWSIARGLYYDPEEDES